eukprot:4710547-Pleurochrysis_carterae.AAC.1
MRTCANVHAHMRTSAHTCTRTLAARLLGVEYTRAMNTVGEGVCACARARACVRVRARACACVRARASACTGLPARARACMSVRDGQPRTKLRDTSGTYQGRGGYVPAPGPRCRGSSAARQRCPTPLRARVRAAGCAGGPRCRARGRGVRRGPARRWRGR